MFSFQFIIFFLSFQYESYRIEVKNSPSQSLYTGIYNQVKLNKPLAKNMVLFSTDNVTIVTSSNDYLNLIVPVDKRIVKIELGIVENSDTITIQTFQFNVKVMPDPYLCYDSEPLIKNETVYPISKNKFSNAKTLCVKLDCDYVFPSDFWKVKSYSFSIDGKMFVANDNQILATLKKTVNNSKVGSKIKLETIDYSKPARATIKGATYEILIIE